MDLPEGARACLNIHSRRLHAPLRDIVAPNSFCAARCAALVWGKSYTKWDAHLAESNVQTRSRKQLRTAAELR